MRRKIIGCSHKDTVTTVTAGLARQVCESCGHVSMRFVEKAVQIYPSGEPVFQRPEPQIDLNKIEGLQSCDLCSQLALYRVPTGLVCDEHAWQAAARIKWDESEPWVPIRIDRSNA